jgi:hypothetical protein
MHGAKAVLSISQPPMGSRTRSRQRPLGGPTMGTRWSPGGLVLHWIRWVLGFDPRRDKYLPKLAPCDLCERTSGRATLQKEAALRRSDKPGKNTITQSSGEKCRKNHPTITD